MPDVKGLNQDKAQKELENVQNQLNSTQKALETSTAAKTVADDELKRAQKNKADVETLQKDTDDRKNQCETEINNLNQSLKACEGKIITEQNSLDSLEKKIRTINVMLQGEGILQSEREHLEAQLAATQESRDASKNQLDATWKSIISLRKKKKSWEKEFGNCER